MAKTKIGYQNLIETATLITVTDEAIGFEKELAYNWRTFDGWKPITAGVVHYTIDLGTAQPVDYWGLNSHTLGTNGGSIKLQYSSDNFAADTNDFDVLISPADDKTLFQSLALPITARYWRFEVTSTPVSILAVLSLGLALESARGTEVGFVLPRQARMNTVIGNVSDGGAFLGRSVIRRGFKSQINYSIQTLAYARGEWNTFLDHAELKPFFFSWNPKYDDPVYCWMVGDPVNVAFDKVNTVSFGMNIEGLI